jgi:Lipid A 3-O-deacylase (PagL)
MRVGSNATKVVLFVALRILVCGTALLAEGRICLGQEAKTIREDTGDFFKKGDLFAEFLAGAYFASGLGPGSGIFFLGPHGVVMFREVDRFEYAPISVRLGYVLHDCVADGTWLRGNTSLLVDWMAAPVTSESGNYVTGPSLLLRYQFQPHNCWLVPYIQYGIGIVLNDAYQDRTQGLIGGPIEFLLQAEGGVHIFVARKWSINLEGGYQHISNAGLYYHNGGVNDVGFTVGATYRFR